MSKVIFANQYYTACDMGDGSIVVTRNRKRGGKRLTGHEAKTWIEAIKTAIDDKEANALCRGFLS